MLVLQRYKGSIRAREEANVEYRTSNFERRSRRPGTLRCSISIFAIRCSPFDIHLFPPAKVSAHNILVLLPQSWSDLPILGLRPRPRDLPLQGHRQRKAGGRRDLPIARPCRRATVTALRSLPSVALSSATVTAVYPDLPVALKAINPRNLRVRIAFGPPTLWEKNQRCLRRDC